jgi:hypothetical protein
VPARVPDRHRSLGVRRRVTTVHRSVPGRDGVRGPAGGAAARIARDERGELTQGMFLSPASACAGAAIERIGIHALFGAFLWGP